MSQATPAEFVEYLAAELFQSCVNERLFKLSRMETPPFYVAQVQQFLWLTAHSAEAELLISSAPLLVHFMPDRWAWPPRYTQDWHTLLDMQIGSEPLTSTIECFTLSAQPQEGPKHTLVALEVRLTVTSASLHHRNLGTPLLGHQHPPLPQTCSLQGALSTMQYASSI